MTRYYPSETIVVAWDAERCIHSGKCLMGLPDVFDLAERPWIRPENATADQIAAVVMRCPSGALHFERKDGGGGEAIPERPVIMPVRNGPLYVWGSVEVQGPDGTVIREDTRMALCRCGQSAAKPFCDNTHRRIGFRTG